MIDQDPTLRPVRVWGGIVVSADRIMHGHESVALVGALARVETLKDIERRQAVTRLLVNNLLGSGKRADRRAVHLTVEADDGAFAVAVTGNSERHAYEAAGFINDWSRRARLAEPTLVDPLQHLARLAALRNAGILTDAEFSAQKTKLLGS